MTSIYFLFDLEFIYIIITNVRKQFCLNFGSITIIPGWWLGGRVAGLIEIKANSVQLQELFISILQVTKSMPKRMTTYGAAIETKKVQTMHKMSILQYNNNNQLNASLEINLVIFLKSNIIPGRLKLGKLVGLNN